MSSRLAFTVFDRYLFSQALVTVLFGVILFTVIWLAPETLFKLVQYVFSGKISPGEALTMFAYHLPSVLQQSIPMAALLGSIFLFRRLSLSYELIALKASGLGTGRLLAPLLVVGVVFAGLHFFIQEWVTPLTSPRLEALYREAGLREQKDSNFVYVEKNRKGQPEKFFLIGQTVGEQLRDFIILYYRQSGTGVQISRILRAQGGSWLPSENVWRLVNGVDYELNAEGVFRENRAFAEQLVATSRVPVALLQYRLENPLDMSWATLKRYIRLLEDGGQLHNLGFYKVRLYQKWAFPLASILFVVFGALLGMEKVRSRTSLGLLGGAVIIFLYCVLIPFSTNVGSLGLAPPALMAWLPLSVALAGTFAVLKVRQLVG